MAEADWTVLNDGLSADSLKRGAIAASAVGGAPNGGGDFVYGMNSLEVVDGAAGLFVNDVNFAPAAYGQSIRGVVKRGASGAVTGWSPFFFVCAQGASVNDNGYLLGLEDDDPHRIVLRKGTLADGVPSDDGGGVLRSSDLTYENDTWLHLRLDAVVNESGDVVLNAYINDLDVNDVDSPVWEAIDGITEFVDDALGIASGSLPYTSGRVGYGAHVEDVTRRSLFDHIEVRRQTGFA
ncbi:MAG: hypothetical protein KKH12_16035 [Gammaproteobacteria bacterium]|nr:hypothetical protein [Gammaproteobacteria bacterium]